MNDNRKQQYLAADVANLTAEIDALLTAYPDLQADEQLRADMLEGSTSLYEVLTRLVAIERDADSMTKAIASRISDLNARKDRNAKRKEAMRALMLRLLRAADVKKASLVEATVSVSKGRDSVEIVDESQVPPRFLKVVKSPDKAAIKEALDAGKKVKGAQIKTGEPTITVRAA